MMEPITKYRIMIMETLEDSLSGKKIQAEEFYHFDLQILKLKLFLKETNFHSNPKCLIRTKSSSNSNFVDFLNFYNSTEFGYIPNRKFNVRQLEKVDIKSIQRVNITIVFLIKKGKYS